MQCVSAYSQFSLQYPAHIPFHMKCNATHIYACTKNSMSQADNGTIFN